MVRGGVEGERDMDGAMGSDNDRSECVGEMDDHG